jgi:hypothetical protein
MKTKHLKFSALILSLFFTANVFAQFSIDGQIRTRSEVRNGYLQLASEDDEASVHISQRSRLIFKYETENLKFVFTPQDVRVWGDDQYGSFSGTAGNDASLDLYEAYAAVRLAESTWLSVGRQSFVYDNQSLLSDGDWAQNPTSAEAIILKTKLSKWDLHLAASWNALKAEPKNNYYVTDRFKSFNFIWLNRKFDNGLNLSLLHVAGGVTESASSNRLYFRHTTGAFASYSKNDFSARGNFYYQHGENQIGKPISAILADGEVSYKIANVTPLVGFGYLSGNKESSAIHTTDNLFDPLYRTRHGYFGFADYFRNFSTHTAQGGLVNYYAGLNYKVSEKVNLLYRAHYLQLAEINEISPNTKYLGFENDIVARYRILPSVNLEAGYSVVIPEKALATIQGVANEKVSQFFYLQLNITPNLFKQK